MVLTRNPSFSTNTYNPHLSSCCCYPMPHTTVKTNHLPLLCSFWSCPYPLLLRNHCGLLKAPTPAIPAQRRTPQSRSALSSASHPFPPGLWPLDPPPSRPPLWAAPAPEQHLACASSRLWSVMAMICCRTSPVSWPGGGPGGGRDGAGDGSAGRGGASMDYGVGRALRRSRRAWSICARAAANRRRRRRRPWGAARAWAGLPPPTRPPRTAHGHAPNSSPQRPRTRLGVAEATALSTLLLP